MARVSILIPAYRPEYFDLCIASAMAQTVQDFELIVSDDCPTDDIERVLSKWKDPRIRYVRNPTRGLYASNRDNLLRLASGEYIKFLFDDDYLYPRSIEALLAAVESTGAKLAIHQRHFVDLAGRILAAPAIVEPGTLRTIPPSFFFSHMVARAANFVGEPTNILFEAKAFRALRLPFGVRGQSFRFLADVAMLCNFARAGHAVSVVGEFLSAFRQHPQQSSNQASPVYAAGIFEWELLLRDAMDEGRLTPEEYAGGLAIVHGLYRGMLGAFPEFRDFLALPAHPRQGDHAGGDFAEALDHAYICLDLRRTRAFSEAGAGT
jgi:hypothetical protein